MVAAETQPLNSIRRIAVVDLCGELKNKGASSSITEHSSRCWSDDVRKSAAGGVWAPPAAASGWAKSSAKPPGCWAAHGRASTIAATPKDTIVRGSNGSSSSGASGYFDLIVSARGGTRKIWVLSLPGLRRSQDPALGIHRGTEGRARRRVTSITATTRAWRSRGRSDRIPAPDPAPGCSRGRRRGRSARQTGRLRQPGSG